MTTFQIVLNLVIVFICLQFAYKQTLKFVEHKKFQRISRINKKWWELHERWLIKKNSNKKVVGYGSTSYVAKKEKNNCGLKVFNPDE